MGKATSFLVCALFAGCGPGDLDGVRRYAETPSIARQAFGDAESADVLADAPWRVQGPDTPIPIGVLIADADTTFFGTELKTIRISLWPDDEPAEKTVYFRDFGTVSMTNSPDRDALWYLQVTRTREGDFPSGIPITARNLIGDGAEGKDLSFWVRAEVAVIDRSNWNDIILKVHVGEARLPHGHGRFVGWFAGDTHVHSTYTHNWVEFGSPHRAILDTGKAIGLDWTITTDHSCDMDASLNPGGFGYVSRRVARYTFCGGDQELSDCKVFDNASQPNGLAMARADAADAEANDGSGRFVVHAGEEVNAVSSTDRTIHLLAFDAPYIQSDGSGMTEYVNDPVTVPLTKVFQDTPDTAMLFASHPTQPLDPGITGGQWGDGDMEQAILTSSFAGLELWNMRKTRIGPADNPYSEDGLNPFRESQPCGGADPECYPYFLDADAIPFWDRWLSKTINSGKRLIAVAGSDAHGDFNYQSKSAKGLTITGANDSAFGKARTVVLTDALTMNAVFDAMRKGRAVLTDGPMASFGVDTTGDGTIEQDGDIQVGDSYELPAGSQLQFIVKWQSTPEFGEISKVLLYRGSEATGAKPDEYDLTTDPQGLTSCDESSRTSAACRIALAPSGTLAPPAEGANVYFRMVALGGVDGAYRCITNPIWIKGGPPVSSSAGPGEPCARAADCGAGLTCAANTCQALCGLGWAQCAIDQVCDPESNVCVGAPPTSVNTRQVFSCSAAQSQDRSATALAFVVLAFGLARRGRRHGMEASR